MAETPREEARLEAARQLVQLAGIAALVVVSDPVLRGKARRELVRAIRSARLFIDGPAPRLPTPTELAALHTEARRITKEAASGA